MVNLNDPTEAIEVNAIEKNVSAPRSKLLGSIRLLFVIVIAVGVVATISYADQLSPSKLIQQEAEPQKSFSAVGIVQEISETSLTINPALDPVGNKVSYTIIIDKVKKIETRSHDPLNLSDILVGDKIIIQGTEKGSGEITARRIISFAPRFPDKPGSMRVAEPALDYTPIATSTESVTTTSTPIVEATSTSMATSTATSTQPEEVPPVVEPAATTTPEVPPPAEPEPVPEPTPPAPETAPQTETPPSDTPAPSVE